MKSKCLEIRQQIIDFYNQNKNTMSLLQIAKYFNVTPSTIKYNVNILTRNIKLEYMKKYKQLPHIQILRKNKQQLYYQKAKNKLKNNPILKEEKRKQKQLRRLQPKVWISDNIRSRIIMSLKSLNNGLKKGGKKWTSLVGYDEKILMEHLKKQFNNNMSWNTHGLYGWHIDHILPISMFNFDSFEHPHFKMCWCLENLRPLEYKENLTKEDKIPTNEELDKWFANDLQRLNTLKNIKNEVLNGKTK